MEQMQKKPKWTILPLLSMIFGIVSVLLYTVFTALSTNSSYSHLFSEWDPHPLAVVLVLGVLCIGVLIQPIVVFGVIGLILGIRAKPRMTKYIVFSIIGLASVATIVFMILIGGRVL